MKFLVLLSLVQYITAAPLDKRAASCTVTSFSNLSGAVSSCKNIVISSLAVPAGETLDLTGLAAGSTVTFEGTTTFGYKEWSGPLVSVAGSGITVQGASGSSLDGKGASYWDGKGSNGGKTKPKFFAAHKLTSNSVIKNVKIVNAPVQVFSINNCDGLNITGVTVDNSAGSSLGHNTDAFDVGSSTNVHISGSTIYNQDDCLAVNSGSGITFTNNYCSGGHGISIGSVGGRSDNKVSDVTVSECTIVNSQNGVRVKTVYGATGSVSDVTYEHITLENISNYGIVIEGDYENGSPTGTPTGGLPITGLTLTDVHGSVHSSGTNVYILVENASGWKWSDINVTGGTKNKSCTGIPSGSGASCS